MKPYLAIFSTYFRLLLQYRAAALAGFATQLFWGFIRIMIFTAFYKASTKTQPMTLEEVISYIWLGQAMFALIPWNANKDIQQLIRTGGVAYELLRPLDLYFFWMSRIVAARIVPTLLRALPMFIAALLFFGLQTPDSFEAVAAWALATAGAVILSCVITAVSTVLSMWTISGEGISQLTFPMVVLFSGLVIPLPFFPDWAQPIVQFLPFRGLGDAPFRLWIGHISPAEALPVFVHQFLWIIAFLWLGRYLISRGLKKLVIQGG